MLRVPVKSGLFPNYANLCRSRSKHSTSHNIRKTFITYFTEIHGHKFIKSSSVIPLCDPTVPFVNAGMNQFKGIFLGRSKAPCVRAVNSQKCIRVGGKHNDLDIVGTDGYHHTFFEMLGNWSFGDYYKREACEMAWKLLLGPFGLKPENLMVTYFAGDSTLGLKEDFESRDIWKSIGVQSSHLKGYGTRENFWEMGATGPCGPCTEIHYVDANGMITEIWNIVFIQFNREDNGSITKLPTHHVDTGMGLERLTALLQSVPSNYDTDLFQPIIKSIEKMGKGCSQYSHKYGSSETLDNAYRCLADHSRMISVCLADGVFPVSSLNLKQIMRKSFKLSEDVFKCQTGMLSELYDRVAETLGTTYTELHDRRQHAKIIIDYEEQSYIKMRANLMKKWKDLVKQYPEVENLHDIELSGFAEGYKQFKQAMAQHKSATIPGDIVFKLYDTHGFPEDIIERVATLNNLSIDKEDFHRLLVQHKTRHKTAFKEQTDASRAIHFNKAIERLLNSGIKSTNDFYKYDYSANNDLEFKPLTTKLVAILNENGEWFDSLTVNSDRNYYLITENTNFYCEEGGQIGDCGYICINKEILFKVDSVFKIKDFVFHKGAFESLIGDIKLNDTAALTIDTRSRLNIMRNHTGIHLLNAAIRNVLPESVVCQMGSHVSDEGIVLNLAVYGKKISQEVVIQAQDLVRKIITRDLPIQTAVLNSMELSHNDKILMIPGERYPETDLRLVQVETDGFVSKELCCGTHLPSTGHVKEFCITLVKGAGSNSPSIHAVTGDAALQVRDLWSRVNKLQEIVDMIEPQRLKQEATDIQQKLISLCGTSGKPQCEYAHCLDLLEKLKKQATVKNDLALQTLAEAEMTELVDAMEKKGQKFIVHFLRCSYLMDTVYVSAALSPCDSMPALVLGCANGVIHAACRVPEAYISENFNAEKWLSCILPIFKSQLAPNSQDQSLLFASMIGTKVSLITCEQQVQDAILAATKFADTHTHAERGPQHKYSDGSTQNSSQNRRHN